MSFQRPADMWVVDGATVDGSTSISRVLNQRGADKLTVLATRSSAYNIVIEWLDPDGTVVNSETQASSATGTTRVSVDAPYYSCRVKVEDAGTADSATASVQANLR